MTKSIFALDSASLKELLHDRGINLRYLGQLALAAKKFVQNGPDSSVNLLEREMIVRAAKFIFNEQLYSTPAHLRAAEVANLLNALLGSPYNSPKVRFPPRFPSLGGL